MSIFYDIEISKDKEKVQAWTVNRLVYPPYPERKRWQIEFKEKLRNYLRELKKPSPYLYAFYSSLRDISEYFDVENILFYNVDDGYKTFNNLAYDTIEFERKFESSPRNRNLEHYACYSLKNSQLYWQKKVILAEWSGINCGSFKLEKVWYEMRRGDIKVLNNYIPGSKLGLDINIMASKSFESIRFNLISILKQFLDGVISAFHYHDKSNFDLVIRVLSQRTSISPVILQSILLDNLNTILGKRKLFWARMNSIQWNPGDDNILYCRIKLNYADVYDWTHNGILFTLQR